MLDSDFAKCKAVYFQHFFKFRDSRRAHAMELQNFMFASLSEFIYSRDSLMFKCPPSRRRKKRKKTFGRFSFLLANWARRAIAAFIILVPVFTCPESTLHNVKGSPCIF
jgi:hypothetical protein